MIFFFIDEVLDIALESKPEPLVGEIVSKDEAQIKKDGKTIILTTHYMEEAEILCDRVAIIDSGEIVKIDSPKNLIAELINSGFVTEKKYQEATLEDVFLDLTGKSLREY